MKIVSGGGSANGTAISVDSGGPRGGAAPKASSSDSEMSAKGIRAVVELSITGGTIAIDSADDAIHSNGSLSIKAGKITLASGDDGVHADSNLRVDGGEIDIEKSYEGIESAVITLNGGTIRLVSRDDGINVAGGVDGSALGGRPGQGSFSGSSSNRLEINGGYIVVDSTGDGLDVNGAVSMTGGTVIVQGPTANNNGALDYDRGFKITGGTLVAVGSSGMAQAPDTTSGQNSVMVALQAVQSAGSMVHIETQAGEQLLAFMPTKAYQSVVVSSSKLKNGTTYLVSTGGNSSGTVTDGVYSGGTHFGGTQAATFTVSGVVTTVGSSRSGFPGGRR